MRVCSKCKKPKPLSEFYKHSATKYRSDCKGCHRDRMQAKSQQHYQSNKDYYRARNRKRAREIMAFIRGYKQDNPTCSDCGEDHPWWRLDFDHLGEKTADVSRAGSRGWSIKRVMAEIAKCELVCSNCHRDRTHFRRTGQESNLPN